MKNINYSDYFSAYDNVFQIEIGESWFTLDSEYFYEVARQYLMKASPADFSKNEHALKVMVYGGAYVLHTDLNKTCEILFNAISGKKININNETRYEFTGEAARKALQGIFSGLHNNSLNPGSKGRIDFDAQPIYNKADNLIIKITYFEKPTLLDRLAQRDPKIKREILLEDTSINSINGNSMRLNIILNDNSSIVIQV